MKKLIAMFLMSITTWAQGPELVVPTGHSNGITAIACVPNSDFIATGSYDNTIILWNIKTKQKIRTFVGHQKTVTNISVHPKGHLMASSSWDHTIRIWEIATGKEIKQLQPGYNNGILSFTTDGKNLISESSIESIDVRKWNTTNWKLEKEVKSKYSNSYNPILQITPNNKTVRHIISYGKDGTRASQFIVSDYEDKVVFFKSKNLTNYETTRVSDDGQWMVIGGKNTLELINLTTKKSSEYRYDGRIERLCFSNDSQKIAIWSERNWYDTTQVNKVAILGLSKNEWWLLAERPTKNSENGDDCLLFSQDSQRLLIGSNDPFYGNLVLWDYDRNEKQTLYQSKSSVYIKDIASKLGILNVGTYYNSFEQTKFFSLPLHDSLRTAIDTSVYYFYSNFGVFKNKEKNISVFELAHYGKKKTSDLREAISSSYSIYRISNFRGDTLIKNLRLDSIGTADDVFFIQNDKYLILKAGSDFSVINPVDWNEINRVESKIISPHVDLDNENKLVATWRGDDLGGRWLMVQTLPEGKLLLDYKTEKEGIEVNSAKIIGSKNKTAATFSDKTLKIFNLNNQHIERTISLPGVDYEIAGFVDTTEKYLVLTNLDNDFNSLHNQYLIIDWQKGKEIAKVYPVDSTDWVVTSPEGFFDASSGAMKKMYYVQSLETFDLEQLKERYWVPGLLQEQLGYTQNGLPPSLKDQRIPLPPTMSVSLKGNLLNIKAQKRTGGMGRVALFIDNIEIASDLRPRLGADSATALINRSIDLGAYQPYFRTGTNLLKVVAYEKTNQISTRGDTLRYVWKGTAKGPIDPMISSNAPPTAVTKSASFYALVVGANTLGLRYASKDAEVMSKVIEKAAKAFIDTTQGKVQVTLFATSQPEKYQPTKANVLRHLDELGKVVSSEDYVFAFFSGHAKAYTNKKGDNDFGLLLQGIRDNVELGKDRFSDFVETNYVLATRTELTDRLNKLPARKKTVVFDACGSETGAQMQANALVLKQNTPNKIKALQNMNDRTGIYVLASSGNNQASYEHPMYEHGFLTYSLLRGVKSGEAVKLFGAETYLEVNAWFRYAENNTPQVAAAVGATQQPKFWTPTQTQSDLYLGIVDDALRNDIKISEGTKLQLSECKFFDERGGDQLGLSKKLNDKLRDEAVNSPNFWFDNTMETSYSLRGPYRPSDGQTVLEVNLYRGEKFLRTVGEFTIKSTETEQLLRQLREKWLDEAAKK